MEIGGFFRSFSSMKNGGKPPWKMLISAKLYGTTWHLCANTRCSRDSLGKIDACDPYWSMIQSSSPPSNEMISQMDRFQLGYSHMWQMTGPFGGYPVPKIQYTQRPGHLKSCLWWGQHMVSMGFYTVLPSDGLTYRSISIHVYHIYIYLWIYWIYIYMKVYIYICLQMYTYMITYVYNDVSMVNSS